MLASAAHAHEAERQLPRDSRRRKLACEGQWDIALRDLEYAIGLDADGDGAITWGELRAEAPGIAAYAFARLKIRADGNARVRLHVRSSTWSTSTATAPTPSLRFAADLRSAALSAGSDIEYSLFFDLDPTHRGLLAGRASGRHSQTAVRRPERPRLSVRALASVSRLAQFVDYVRDGIWHIWIGFDHVLFLVSSAAAGGRCASRNARLGACRALRADVLGQCSRSSRRFTVAHSITLSLAALAVIQLPSRLVESAIALSVLLARR